MDVKLETMSLTPHPLSVQTCNQANKYDDPFASWYSFNSDMATKSKPTQLGLPFEIRQVIREYTKPEDIDITLDKVDWRKNYRGSAAEKQFDARPLLLVNRQIYDGVCEIHKRKISLSLADVRIAETHLPRMSYNQRNLVTSFRICKAGVAPMTSQAYRMIQEAIKAYEHDNKVGLKFDIQVVEAWKHCIEEA
jgi:hypothetical protein